MNDKIKNFIKSCWRWIIETSEGHVFFGGSVSGFFAGFYFLFNHNKAGESDAIVLLMKLGMACALAISTGTGSIIVQWAHKRIKLLIRKRKIKKYARKRKEQSHRRTA